MLKLHKFIFNPLGENTYIVWDDTLEAIIIDPGALISAERDRLLSFIGSQGIKPVAILLTHAHMDHIFGVQSCVEKYNIPVYMDPREEASINGFNVAHAGYEMDYSNSFQTIDIADGDIVRFGNSQIRALSTPGHSMGGICWWIESAGMIFTGDTLFAGSIGRTDNRWASWDMLISSIKNTLMALDGEVDVFPGHGPATSIGQERLTNPFIVDEFGDQGYEG